MHSVLRYYLSLFQKRASAKLHNATRVIQLVSSGARVWSRCIQLQSHTSCPESHFLSNAAIVLDWAFLLLFYFNTPLGISMLSTVLLWYTFIECKVFYVFLPLWCELSILRVICMALHRASWTLTEDQMKSSRKPQDPLRMTTTHSLSLVGWGIGKRELG
jgi:hypothetical protein